MCHRALAAQFCGRTMAFVIRNCILILTVLTVNLAVKCPESCRCRDDTVNWNAISNETTPIKNTSVAVVNMCCDTADNILTAKLGSHSNVTYTKVTITNEHKCDAKKFSFVYPNLTTTTLILKNNSIEKLYLAINATQLKHLDLSLNQIHKLENKTINAFKNLYHLEINNNKLINLSTDCFSGLSNLQYLDLSNNHLTKLDNVFYPLKNLRHLNLSRNNLEFLSETNFNNGLLQHLDVSYNQLTKVAAGALQCLPNLARLLLTDNPALGATQLDGQLLVGAGRRLQQVDVSRTGLDKIPEAFTHSVRFLSLDGNQLIAIHCGDLDSYPLLQSLDFTDNRVQNIEDDSFGRLEMLLFLNLNKNLLSTIPKMLPDELKYLSMNDNLVRNLSMPDFNNLPNLRILLLQNNKIEFIQENVFAPLPSLEVLDLSNNPVRILTPSTFTGPFSLRDLRLCYLNISLPEGDATFPVPSPEGLQMLHLQSSPGLARQLLADSAVLAALNHLQYLDLRMNHLTDVRSDLVFYLAQLRTLRLHGNHINCTSIDWLQEWLSWNNSSMKNETCYFSEQTNSDELNRYNCTFSETFTINDSLPPVSLYSTEMINKLLKYYGFGNRTELNVKAIDMLKYNHTTNLDKYNTNTSSSTLPDSKEKRGLNFTDQLLNDKISNEIKKNKEIKIASSIRSSNDILTAHKQELMNSKVYMQTRMPGENIDTKRLLSTKKITYRNTLEVPNKEIENTAKHIRFGTIKTGKTVNRPTNRTRSRLEEAFDKSGILKTIQNETKVVSNTPTVNISVLPLLNSPNSSKRYDVVTLQDKSESSPYQSNSSRYASYVGVLAVMSLIVVCLVLWASLRSRYRQRRRTPPQQEIEDHIEVASISGGVLW